MQQDVGVGIIGTGFGALVHLPGFLRVSAAKVIGIASKERARSAELAAQYDLPQAFDSAETLIAHPSVQLVSIATTPLQHVDLVQKVIAAGKHVLCEKPFTFHGAQAQMLLESAQMVGVVHGVDFEFRELSAMQLLHDQIVAGAIGSVQSAEFRWEVGTWADPTRFWRWQCDKDQGGGVMGALGVHLFDAVEWLIGPVQKLNADLTTKITERADASGDAKAVTAEDTVNLQLQSVSDILVNLHVSNVDAAGKGLNITIRGDKGTLRLESLSQDYATGLRVMLNEASILEDQPVLTGDARIRPFQMLATRLIQAIKSNNRFEPSFVQGLRSDLLYEAAWKSQAEGHGWVDIARTAP